MLVCLSGCTWGKNDTPAPMPRAAASVGAFGTIVPKAQLRNLSLSGNSTEPAQIIEFIHVQEGDSVRKGQILVTLKNKQQLEHERMKILESINQYKEQLSQSTELLKRFKSLTNEGGYAWSDYQQRLIIHEGIVTRLVDAKLRLDRIMGQINNTVLVAPFAGTVTQIYSRSGEIQSKNGVLQIGDLDQLQAQLEVYESDMLRIKKGQSVVVRSDTNAFEGDVKATVSDIVPGIRMRTNLPTTATPTVDVRVGIVRALFSAADSQRLRRLVGAKVLAKIYQ
jgi:multidrug efflux pump subunit AcrA (membrane-fusion protein)